jgi:hypothetical protein
VIISGGGILPVPARTDHNRENPAIGYDYRITASTFLPFSGVFPSETTTFPRVPVGNPWNRGPESLSWVLTSIDVCSYYFSRIFFRLLLKSFRRLADTFLPIHLYERIFLDKENKETKKNRGNV